MSAQPNESTSEPIYKAAKSVGAGVTALLGLLGGAVALGLLSTEQADAVTAAGNQLISNLPALAAAITTVVGLVSGIVASLATAWHARKQVVPVDSDTFAITAADPAAGPLDHG